MYTKHRTVLNQVYVKKYLYFINIKCIGCTAVSNVNIQDVQQFLIIQFNFKLVLKLIISKLNILVALCVNNVTSVSCVQYILHNQFLLYLLLTILIL